MAEAIKVPEAPLVWKTDELAEKLGVTPRTIENWTRRRLLEHIKIDRVVRYTPKAVGDFLENHTIKTN